MTSGSFLFLVLTDTKLGTKPEVITEDLRPSLFSRTTPANTVATGHMWLLSTCNVTSETEKLSFPF